MKSKLIIKLTGSRSEIVFKPIPADDPARWKPVIDLAKKKLGWIPMVNLHEGLTRTIKYFQEVIGLTSMT